MTAIIAMPKYTERSWGKKGLGAVVRYKIDRGQRGGRRWWWMKRREKTHEFRCL